MKRLIIINCSIYLLLAFPFLSLTAGVSTADSTLKSSIDSLAAIHLDKTQGIGFVIGINEEGIERVFYYGSSQKKPESIADSGSLYELGPLSATFTSILFSDMALKGEIGYDDPIQKYLPFDVLSPVYQKIICKPLKDAGVSIGLQTDPSMRFTPYVCLPDINSTPQPILLCYLATHTSGLPDFPYNVRSLTGETTIYQNYSKENLYDFLKDFRLVEPISYNYNYSELGVALLGHIISLRKDSAFDSILSKRIFQPLGMNSSSFIRKEDSQNKLLTGYTASLKIAKRRQYDLFAPAGGLNSTISDMMKFLDANLGNTNPAFKNVLDYTHNPRILLTDNDSKDIEIAMGWKIRRINDEGAKAIWQGGSTEGFASFIAFEEIKKRGVVILSNSSVSVEALGFEVLKLIEKP